MGACEKSIGEKISKVKKGEKMDYPKEIMSISEMKAMGYPKDYLYRAVHSKHAPKFAIQTSRRGKWLIKTSEFEKIQNRGCLR